MFQYQRFCWCHFLCEPASERACMCVRCFILIILISYGNIWHRYCVCFCVTSASALSVKVHMLLEYDKLSLLIFIIQTLYTFNPWKYAVHTFMYKTLINEKKRNKYLLRVLFLLYRFICTWRTAITVYWRKTYVINWFFLYSGKWFNLMKDYVARHFPAGKTNFMFDTYSDGYYVYNVWRCYT